MKNMNKIFRSGGGGMYSFYKNRIDYLKQQILIKFSMFGFGINCKYAICNRIQGTFPGNAIVENDCLQQLINKDCLFINSQNTNINECVHLLKMFLLKNTELKLYFLICGEPQIPFWIIETLLPHAISFYIQNNHYDHPLIHNLPIGIRDGEEVFKEHQYFSGQYLLNETRVSINKEYLCLLCFSYTHNERRECENILGGKQNEDFIINLNQQNVYNGQLSIHCGKVPVWINYQYTHKSHYVLSPSGVGEATHRFFEAIALKTIPIVKKTNTSFDKLYYSIYPCLVVNNWEEVTKDFLLINLQLMQNKMTHFHETYPNFLVNINYENMFDFFV
jgi:hypothetical protein